MTSSPLGADGQSESADLRTQLAEARETLRAIRHGEVDALVVADGSSGEQVFTLSSADRPYRMFVETMRDGAATVSASGLILFANRRLAEMLGRPLSQIIGQRLGALVGAGHDSQLARILRPRTVEPIELDLIGTGGRLIPVRVCASAAAVESEQLIYLTLADLTQSRADEQRLVTAHEEALEASRLRSQFVANMTHEIRTPLNGVIGLSRLLASTSLDEEQREYTKGMETSGSALTAVVDDILDFAKVETGRLFIEEVPFPLRTLVEDVCFAAALHARVKGVEMLTWVDEALPAIVSGDAHRVSQILGHLLSNAIKFTASGEIRVRVMGDPAGASSVRFEVTDTGVGINPTALGEIFQSFSQADGSSTRAYGGVGLGLAISEQLAELMGGEIGVESIEGEGSTFWVTLPLAAAAVGDVPPELPDRPAIEPGHGSGPRVLLAEDNAVNQLVAVRMLEKQGFRVDVAANGQLALDMWERESHTTVFMDCQMPVLDGYEATAEIRRREEGGDRRTVIIALTANTANGDRERCLAAGMDDYIAKPVSQGAIRDAVIRTIGGERVPPSSGIPRSDGLVGARSASEQPLIDRALLDEVCGGDSMMQQDLVALFGEGARASLNDIHQAIEAGDAAALGREAHKLKGSAATVGALRVADLSDQLCQAARAGLLADGPSLFDQLEDGLTRTFNAWDAEPAANQVSP
ncbi:MAG: response regulator [Thermoleophilaceae bacterium]|nr:response regulator [Thermoleophilaceae bacterium]